MGAKDNLQRLYDRKQEELTDLEDKAKDLRIYLQAIQDSLKVLPKEIGTSSKEPFDLRPNTAVSATRDVLRKRGEPLHISEILKALGKAGDKKERLSLGGSLSGYVRNNQIFTRPAPNTFGLTEFETGKETAAREIPASFGKV